MIEATGSSPFATTFREILASPPPHTHTHTYTPVLASCDIELTLAITPPLAPSSRGQLRHRMATLSWRTDRFLAKFFPPCLDMPPPPVPVGPTVPMGRASDVAPVMAVPVMVPTTPIRMYQSPRREKVLMRADQRMCLSPSSGLLMASLV